MHCLCQVVINAMFDLDISLFIPSLYITIIYIYICIFLFFLSWVSKTQPFLLPIHFTNIYLFLFIILILVQFSSFPFIFKVTGFYRPALPSSVQFSPVQFSFIFKSDWGPDPEDARPLPASQCGSLYPDPFSPSPLFLFWPKKFSRRWWRHDLSNFFFPIQFTTGSTLEEVTLQDESTSDHLWRGLFHCKHGGPAG